MATRRGSGIAKVSAAAAPAPDPGVTPARAAVDVTLNWANDGDANGLVNYLGTKHQTAAFTNPTYTDPKLLEYIYSSIYPGYPPNNLFDRQVGTVFNSGGNGPNDFVGIDLGAGSGLVPSRYTLRQRNDTVVQVLTAFDFQGSTDGVNWVTLDSRSGIPPTLGSWISFPVTTTTRYRYLRVRMVDNSDHGAYLILSEFEVYGQLHLAGVIPFPVYKDYALLRSYFPAAGYYSVTNEFGWNGVIEPNYDPVLKADIGDLVEVSVNAHIGEAGDLVDAMFDIYTVDVATGGTQLNSFGALNTSSNSSKAIMGLFAPAGQPSYRSATVTRVLTANDIDTGHVRLKLVARLSAAGSKKVFASPTDLLTITAVNRGPIAA